MKERIEALNLLLDAYVEMVRMKACEQGEKSHALWYSTVFIKRQIRDLIKSINEIKE